MFEDHLLKYSHHPFHPTDSTPIESIDDEIELTIPDKFVIDQYEIRPSRHPAKVKVYYNIIAVYSIVAEKGNLDSDLPIASFN